MNELKIAENVIDKFKKEQIDDKVITEEANQFDAVTGLLKDIGITKLGIQMSFIKAVKGNETVLSQVLVM